MAEPRAPWTCPSCRSRLATGDAGLVCPGCGGAVARDPDALGGVLRFAPELEPAGFPPERRDHLAALARGHFWFAPRRRLLARLIDRWVPAEERRAAVELGCGTGGFLETLCRRFATVAALDAYAESLSSAVSSPTVRETAELAQADVLAAPLAAASFDLVAALDVLEHVPPGPFLAETARLARPGGRLLLTVPAGPSLWSALDVAAGHRCRYTLPRLRGELAAAGWNLVHWTHYQFVLWPLVWASRRWLAAARGDGTATPLERRPPAVLGRLLGAVNHAEVRALGRLRLPLGSSLVTLARRPS